MLSVYLLERPHRLKLICHLRTGYKLWCTWRSTFAPSAFAVVTSPLRTIARCPMAYWMAILEYSTDTNVKLFVCSLTPLCPNLFFLRSLSQLMKISSIQLLKKKCHLCSFLRPLTSHSATESHWLSERFSYWTLSLHSFTYCIRLSLYLPAGGSFSCRIHSFHPFSPLRSGSFHSLVNPQQVPNTPRIKFKLYPVSCCFLPLHSSPISYPYLRSLHSLSPPAIEGDL